ncbi:MAG: GNAT family N-acetyltransferase [Methylococcales bacterium]|nr:GNAT family N-acetyltransferase [Methylococcales bacterium]MDD5753903.1 GNAT family N-acetyltransferase [Methylococcales bacterium]
MKITLATASDIPALCDLLALLFSQEADFQPDYEAQRRGLTHILNNPDVGLILVARQKNQIVGMVNLLFTFSTALGQRVALLEDLVVAPSRRGNGIGSQLLKQTIETARLHDCHRITLLTDLANESAQRFYRKHGFVFSAMIPMRVLL